jgi:hypothetical protein
VSSKLLTFVGAASVLGRTLVVTEQADDFGKGSDGTEPIAASTGAPLAVGVIGFASSP